MTLLSGTVMGTMSGGIKVAYDDISAALADDPARVTFAYNDANELTKQISNGTQSAYTYDDWGRTTTKITADTTEEFLYFAGSKLKTYKVGGSTVASYNYDGFGKSRNISEGSNVTWWRYDLGWNMIAEYDDSDVDWDVETRVVSNTYTRGQKIAQSAGTNPSTGTYRYVMGDLFNEKYSLYDGDDNEVGKFNPIYGNGVLLLGSAYGIVAQCDECQPYWDQFEKCRRANPNSPGKCKKYIDRAKYCEKTFCGEPPPEKPEPPEEPEECPLPPEDCCGVKGRYAACCGKWGSNGKSYKECKAIVDEFCGGGYSKCMSCCESDKNHCGVCAGEGPMDELEVALNKCRTGFDICRANCLKKFPKP